jgi:hypothetical protein
MINKVTRLSIRHLYEIKIIFLLISLLSISASHSASKVLGLQRTGDKVSANFLYHVSMSWSEDVKNAVVNYTMFVRLEDKDKNKHPFLFFSYCSKPDEFWLYGYGAPHAFPSTVRGWGKEHPDKVPRPHSAYSDSPPINRPNMGIVNGKGESIYFMSTGVPIDISSLVGVGVGECGELYAGYGLGAMPREAYNEMLSQERYDVIFYTRLGPVSEGFILEVTAISAPNRPHILPPICPFHKGCL